MGRKDVKNIQFTLQPEEHQFMALLAAANDTTISEIFRAYVAYLMGGGKLVGMLENKDVVYDAKTGEIRVKV
ncbi:MAG: hypothetical protein AB1815_05900 [Bacillota bacterium]